MDDTRESLLIISNNRAITIASGDSYEFKNGDHLVLPEDTVIEQLKFQGNDLVVKNKGDDFIIKNFLSFQQEGTFHSIPLLLAENVTLSPLALLDQLRLPIYNTEQLPPNLVQNIAMLEHVDSGVNEISSLDDDRDDHDWSIVHSNSTFNRKTSIINAQIEKNFGELNSTYSQPLIHKLRFGDTTLFNDQSNDESSFNDDKRSTERENTAILTAVVIDRNAAPVIIANGSLSNILEDEANPAGDSITSLIGSSFSDADFGDEQGVAIVGADNSNGQWQYTTDGSVWNDVSAVSNSNAILLQSADPNTRIRFVPDADHSGDSGNLTYRAWDKTTGSNADTGVNVSSNGGTTAFSSSTETVSLTVIAVNDAPVLDNTGLMSLTSINEDNTTSAGDLVSAIVTSAGGDRITDADSGDPEGIAVYNLGAASGSWEYKIGAGSWTAVGVVNGTSALLLAATDTLRFVPDTLNGESVSFDFYAWDQTSGTAGTKVDMSTRGGTTAFSTASENVIITVTDVNDAPTLSGNGSLSNVVEDDSDPSGDNITNLVAATISDVDTGAVEGVAITGADNANGQWQYTINGSTWNNISGVSDANAILLQSADLNTSVRFVPDADYTGTSGNLTYRAWDKTTGSNGDTGVNVSTNGGTTAYSSASETASLTVTASNDAPVLDNSGTISLISITEDKTASSGDLVSAIIASAGGDRITDADSGDPEGIAVYNLGAASGSWEYKIGAGSWTAVGVVNGTSALLLAATDVLRFVPDTLNGEAPAFDFYAWDGTSGTAGTKVAVSTRGGSTAFSTASENVVITVTSVNDAPTISGSGTLSNVVEDDSNPSGDTITNLVAATISDVDTGAVEGVAVTGADNTNGQWQYTINGSTWNNITGVSDANAILLQSADANTRVRFVPNADYNGSSGNLSYRAWDKSTGSNGDTGVDVSTNGGTTAYSSSTETASLTVTTVNDAPVLDNSSTMTLTSITEDNITSSGDVVSAIIASAGGDRITDADPDPEGIAVYNLGAANGAWEYKIGAGSWTVVGAVNSTSALLLTSLDSMRFIPDTFNGETADFDFYAWDQSSGTAGTKVDVSSRGGTTAFSTASENVTITVTSVNDAPTISGNGTLTNVVEDDSNPSGDTITNLVAATISDVDTGAVEGVAVTGADNTNGQWQYTINGSTWNNISGVSDANAILLQSADVNTSVRFVPDADYTGTSGNLTYRAWDKTTGSNGDTGVDVSTNGGTTAYSSTTETASLTVTTVNDAPVLGNSGAMSLTSINEDNTTGAGDLVSAIIASAGGDRITDPDSGDPEGIAVYNLGAANGAWEYKIGAGAWTAVGVVNGTSALLLAASDALRFVPDTLNGESPTFDFYAWDGTSGTAGSKVDVSSRGGTTAFSTASENVTITVTSVNDAPTLSGNGSLTNVVEDNSNPSGDTITNLVAATISDVDTGAVEGVAITGADNTNGQWQYTINGSTWNNITGVSDANAILLQSADANTRVRFVPNADYNGSSGNLSYRAWDKSTGSNGDTGVDVSTNGGTTAYSSSTETASLTVTASNDAPVLDNTGLMSLTSINEDNTTSAGDLVSAIIASAGGDRITDADPDPEGIAVYNLAASNGHWEYKLGVGAWTDVGTVNTSSALLLAASDAIRFVPDTQNGESVSFDFYAWDTTSGSAGSKVDVSVRGGTTAFSTASENVTITVNSINDAPVVDTSETMKLSGIIEDDSNPSGDTVADIITSTMEDRISDVDTGAAEGLAVVTIDDGNGTWQYSLNGGSLWNNFGGGISNSSAVLLDDSASTKIRFLPDAGFSGTATITFRAWDQSSGSNGDTGVDTSTNGGTTAFSTATSKAGIGVNHLNLNVTEVSGEHGFRLNGEYADQQTGWSVNEVGDMNGDGFDDFMIGSDYDGVGTREVYIIYGKSGTYTNPFELSSITATDGFNILDSGGQKFGKYIGGLGDINGDGYADVIVGDYYDDTNGSNAGAAYVIFGSGSLGASIDVSSLNGSNGFVIHGRDSGDDMGRDVSGVGDINADGYDDFLIGAEDATPNGSDSGEAYLIFGKGAAFNASYDIDDFIDGTQGVQFNGPAADDEAGGVVGGGGDYNNDGYADLLIAGSTGDTANGTNSGEAYVVFGKKNDFASTIELSALSGSNGFTIAGLAAGDELGHSFKHGGDINGDGIDDFIVAAYNSDVNGSDSGQTYVIFGTETPFPASFDLTTLNGSNGFRLNGISSSDQAGQGADTIGDFNGDGYDDIVLGSDRNVVTNDTGQAYVLFGAASFAGTIELSTLDGSNGFYINGTVTDSRFSRAQDDESSAGDINGDGYADIVVAAADDDPNGSDSGTTYVLYGYNHDASHVGTAGNDSITGDAGANIVNGGLGDDLLDGGAGIDVLIGANGDDYLVFDSADRRIDGGNGNDFLSIEGGGTYTIDSSVKNIENFYLDDNNYTLTITHPEGLKSIDASGLTGSNSLTLDMSAHTFGVSITSGAGNDDLQGGVGADVIDAGAGNDIIAYDANDLSSFTTLKIDGGIGGDDTYQLNSSGESLDLTTINNNVIKGIERVDITGTGNNTLTVDLSDVLDISATSDTLTIDGDSGDSVIDSNGGWTFQSTAGGYHTYTDAAATLLVDADISTITLV